MQLNVRDAVVRTALTALIDYAGLFPPAKLAMPQAAAEYTASRTGPYAWMLGKFIVPLSRMSELLSELPASEQFPLSVILDGGMAGLAEVARLLREEPRVSPQALEIVLAPEQIGEYAASLRELGLEGLPSYVEFRRDAGWRETLGTAMPALAAHRLGAKIRCGGLDAAAFPSPLEVAQFIERASRERVPFKATAGLHHPVRHYNAASGFTMHGFLNILAAAALARTAATTGEIEEVVALEENGRFRFDDRGFHAGAHEAGIEVLESVRRDLFVAYGSCSFSEPVDDLRSCGVLA